MGANVSFKRACSFLAMLSSVLRQAFSLSFSLRSERILALSQMSESRSPMSESRSQMSESRSPVSEATCAACC